MLSRRPPRLKYAAAALLICLLPLFSLNAFALEDPAESVSEAVSEEALPSPAPEASPRLEEAPLPEESPLPTESQPPQEEGALTAESSLLRTGGHETYLSGYKGALFQPNKMMTRAEAAQMLYSLLQEPPAAESGRFSDVKDGSWYAKAVNTLAQLGVINGYKDGTFFPSGVVTRAAFVTMVVNCFDLPEGQAAFGDVPETNWAYPAIAAATTQGWLSGYKDGTFRPNQGIKRSEAVTVMNQALGRTGEGFAARRDTQLFKDVPNTHWAYLQITEAAMPIAEPDPTPTPTPTPVAGFAVGDTVSVTASALNLRSQPNTDCDVVAVLNYGARLTVTAISGDWLGVRDANNRSGYVHSDYVVKYVPGGASGASLSTSSVTLHQYQSVRVDASIESGDLGSMTWSSSAPGIANLGYIVEMGESRTYAAILYANSPGTAVVTFSDQTGATSASCTVTVLAAEPVRFAYSSENCATAGQPFDLIAITDPAQTQVTFSVAGESYPTELYTTETRSSQYSLPDNRNHVFRRSVTFQNPGTYEVTASAGGGFKTFSLLVLPGGGKVNTTSADDRMTSTRELRLIAAYEGAIPEVEDDTIAWGNPTVGYGYVVRQNVTFYNNLTSSELYAMLADKVNTEGYAALVNRFRANNNLRMSQAQFDALVSFVYNCGSAPLDLDYTAPKVMLNAVAPPAGLSESQPVAGKLNIDDGALYESASVNAKVLTQVPENARITVIGVTLLNEKRQVWYLARYNSQTGYIPAGLVQLDTSGLVHDLAYADATILANNILQWNMSAGEHWAGLVYRRLAECKVFFFGDYDEADPNVSWSNYKRNTYGFIYPDNIKQYEE